MLVLSRTLSTPFPAKFIVKRAKHVLLSLAEGGLLVTESPVGWPVWEVRCWIAGRMSGKEGVREISLELF